MMHRQVDKIVIACIAVRMKSTRLPQKALADVAGKPMTLRLIERLRAADTIDRIVVCTSTHPDDAILVAPAGAARALLHYLETHPMRVLDAQALESLESGST